MQRFFDLNNEAHEKGEEIIDEFYEVVNESIQKPRTFKDEASKAFL